MINVMTNKFWGNEMPEWEEEEEEEEWEEDWEEEEDEEEEW
jgi:hypothetical protein